MTTSCIPYAGQPLRRYPAVRWQGRQMGAHRRAWIQAHGPIPDDLYVCHTCDNPRCINVEHLFLGSPKDNMTDKVEKGRARGAASGEDHHNARLSANQVCEIRARHAAGDVMQKTLAADYGVSKQHISHILKGRFWPHAN